MILAQEIKERVKFNRAKSIVQLGFISLPTY